MIARNRRRRRRRRRRLFILCFSPCLSISFSLLSLSVEADTFGNDDDVELLAVGWNDNHKKTYLTTFGKAEDSTKQAAVRRQDQHQNTYLRYHNQPTISQVYHSGSHLIDDHNRITQNLIGLEYAWVTDDCWKRLVACLIETCAADAYLLGRKINPAHANVQVKIWIRELARQVFIFVSNVASKLLTNPTPPRYR